MHEECLTGFTDLRRDRLSRGDRLGRDVRPRPGRADGRRDRRATWPLSACTRGCPRCSTSCATTAGAGSRRRSARTRTSSAMLGAAYVRGLQSAGVIATLKHFAGYSASRAARNHGPVSMGRRELLDVILPPFETAVALGRRRLGDELLLRRRRRPGRRRLLAAHRRCCATSGASTGTVVSDYWAVPFLATMHRVAADTDDAGALALAAGIDVELPDTLGFGAGLVERVRRGELPEELVDRAARRLLTAEGASSACSTRTGRPRRSVAGAGDVDLDSPANRALAREMAERSVVLLDAGDRAAAARRGPAAAPGRRRRPVRRRPAHVHGLLRLPQPRAAPPPGPRARHRGADRARRPARRAARRRGRRTSRAAPCTATTGPASPPRSPPPGTPTCASRSSATWPGCSDTARPARAATPRTCGCPACRPTCSTSCSPPARRWSSWSSPAVRTRSASVHGRAAGAGAGVHAGRGGRRGDRRRAVRPGRSPAASCRCRSRGTPGGQPGTYLQPPLGRRAAPASAASTRPRCSRSGTARPTPPSRSTTCGSAPPRCPPTASSP